MAGNYYSDNTDIHFHIAQKMPIEPLFALLTEEERACFDAQDAKSYRQSVLDILESFGPVCDDMASRSHLVDDVEVALENGKEQVPAVLTKNLETILSFGFSGGGVATEYGGFGIPFFCEMAGAEMLNRACPSTAISAHWFASVARVIEKYGSEELKNEYVPRLARGEISGNMALTEPNAGSDLSGISTYAVPQEDASWRIYGTKRFITNGSGGISLVLAKTQKGAVGLDKLSLFLCPRFHDNKDNIKLLKIEKKIGLHGSITAELAYDGAKAWLLGEKNAGFRYMLDLMNESRIGVAFQALGIMEATFRLANDYAQERHSWGKAIAKHELIADRLLDMEVELKAARSLCYETVYFQSMRNLLERRLRDGKAIDISREDLEKQLKKVTREVRRRTPLAKYWLSEKAVDHARIGIQIHGGYGYMHEYKAEWLLREALIYPLYEGTSQIQALMCIKDALKEVLQNPKRFAEKSLRGSLSAWTATDTLERKFAQLQEITAKSLLVIFFKLIKANTKNNDLQVAKLSPKHLLNKLNLKNIKIDNLSPALLQAEHFCELKCMEALASCVIKDAEVDPSRHWIAERFLFKALPRATYLYTLIKANDRVLQKRLES